MRIRFLPAVASASFRSANLGRVQMKKFLMPTTIALLHSRHDVLIAAGHSLRFLNFVRYFRLEFSNPRMSPRFAEAPGKKPANARE